MLIYMYHHLKLLMTLKKTNGTCCQRYMYKRCTDGPMIRDQMCSFCLLKVCPPFNVIDITDENLKAILKIVGT